MDGPLSAYRILAVDDNPGDLRLLEEAIREIAVPITMTRCKDGASTLKLLHTNPRFQMILSDLNMPGMNGVELAQHLQADPRLRHIPFVLMSSRSYERLPSSVRTAITVPYVTKATSWDGFLRLAAELFRLLRRRASDSSGRHLTGTVG